MCNIGKALGRLVTAPKTSADKANITAAKNAPAEAAAATAAAQLAARQAARGAAVDLASMESYGQKGTMITGGLGDPAFGASVEEATLLGLDNGGATEFDEFGRPIPKGSAKKAAA